MEQNGMEWNRVEWNGMEWNGMEWSGMEWSGVEWNGMEWNGMEWNGMEWWTGHVHPATYPSSVFQSGGRFQSLIVLSSDTDTSLERSSLKPRENITPWRRTTWKNFQMMKSLSKAQHCRCG